MGGLPGDAWRQGDNERTRIGGRGQARIDEVRGGCPARKDQKTLDRYITVVKATKYRDGGRRRERRARTWPPAERRYRDGHGWQMLRWKVQALTLLGGDLMGIVRGKRQTCSALPLRNISRTYFSPSHTIRLACRIAAGLLYPPSTGLFYFHAMIAAAAMSLSVRSLISNALRLRPRVGPIKENGCSRGSKVVTCPPRLHS